MNDYRIMTTQQINVVTGVIQENELGNTVFYWANFLPHYNNNTMYIIGECSSEETPGLEEKMSFFYTYNIKTDSVFVSQYSFINCSPELYEKYYLNIMCEQSNEYIAIPWNKIIAIPQLIEHIFGSIPEKIVFQ